MELQLYGLGEQLKEELEAIPFRTFCEAFDECVIILNPDNERDGHWIIKNELKDIRFYTTNKKSIDDIPICFVDFEYEDIGAFREHGGLLNHPIWEGLFKIIKDWPLFLTVNPPGAPTCIAKGIVIGKQELANKLPSWIDDRYHIFVCHEYNDFRSIIASGWELSRQYAESSEPRYYWADSKAIDERAIFDFKHYLNGSRGSKKKYEWHGRPVKPRNSSGSFLDMYGTSVDWRDYDESIANYFSEMMKEEVLSAEAKEYLITLRYNLHSKDISYDEIGDDRYVMIREINNLISQEYEIRVVSASIKADTHCFLIAPNWLWNELEKNEAGNLIKKIKKITPTDRFN